MANRFYNSFRNKLLDIGAAGSIDFNTDVIKAALIDEGTYTYSAAHDFLDDVPAGIIGTAQTIGTPTVGVAGVGVFDGDNVTFTAVTGASVESILLYKDTGAAATSPLIGIIDQVASGLPVTPNGGNITITWDNGGNGIIRVG